MPQIQNKPALVEARWVIKILVSIIGGLFAVFIVVGWISDNNATERMKACVSKSDREWTNNECVFPHPSSS